MRVGVRQKKTEKMEEKNREQKPQKEKREGKSDLLLDAFHLHVVLLIRLPQRLLIRLLQFVLFFLELLDREPGLPLTLCQRGLQLDTCTRLGSRTRTSESQTDQTGRQSQTRYINASRGDKRHIKGMWGWARRVGARQSRHKAYTRQRKHPNAHQPHTRIYANTSTQIPENKS